MAKIVDGGYLPPEDPIFHEPWTITPLVRPSTRPTPTAPPGETKDPEEPPEEKQGGE